MSSIVPSYIAKVARAQRHLVDLKAAIDDFAGSHPYHVTTTLIESKNNPRTVRKLEFTSDPENTDIPILAADLLHNLRSGLDHLMTALVERRARGHVYFPIYFQGVWEPGPPGENAARAKDRSRWATDTRTVAPGALAILKDLQPPDGGNDQEANMLRVLNTLANTDRHQRLPIVARGLRKATVQWTNPYGSTVRSPLERRDFLTAEQAEIKGIPSQAVDVKIYGEVIVTIRYRVDNGVPKHIEIPGSFDRLILVLKGGPELALPGVIPDLLPFVQGDAP